MEPLLDCLERFRLYLQDQLGIGHRLAAPSANQRGRFLQEFSLINGIEVRPGAAFTVGYDWTEMNLHGGTNIQARPRGKY